VYCTCAKYRVVEYYRVCPFIDVILEFIFLYWSYNLFVLHFCYNYHAPFKLQYDSSVYFVGGFVSYVCCLYWFTYSGFQHDLTLWVTWRVSYNKQELLTLRKHLAMDSPRVFLVGSVLLIALVFCVVGFGGIRVAHRFSCLCYVFLFCLSSPCVLKSKFWQRFWII
jgi:hypothetical protein